MRKIYLGIFHHFPTASPVLRHTRVPRCVMFKIFVLIRHRVFCYLLFTFCGFQMSWYGGVLNFRNWISRRSPTPVDRLKVHIKGGVQQINVCCGGNQRSWIQKTPTFYNAGWVTVDNGCWGCFFVDMA